MRTDAGWIDATVRNVSVRGMQLHSPQPLRRNEFVEIARGQSRVVGRIVWSNEMVCGLKAQDAVDIDGLLSAPTSCRPAAGENARDRRTIERPSAPVHAPSFETRAQSARLLGRAIEKTILVVAIACGGALAIGSAFEAMADPLEKVSTALAASPR